MLAPGRIPRQMDIRRTTTFRLTAGLGAVFIVTLIGVLGLIYVLTQREMVQRADAVLNREAQAFAQVPSGQLARSVRSRLAASTSQFNHYALIDGTGRLVAGDFAPSPIPPPGHPADIAPSARSPVPMRLLVLDQADGGRLVIGRDISQVEDLRRRVVTILLTSGSLAVVAVLLAAVLLSIAPLRRIQRLVQMAGRIGTGELALRMTVSARGDELDVVAVTINAMLEEIAYLLNQVKGATDAIAHDLRAPLAHARSRLEAARRQAGSGQAHSDQPAPDQSGLIDIAIEQLDTVLVRFNALLRIAELEAANRIAGFGPIDPMTLAAGVCELYEPLAEERGVHLVLSGTWGHPIRGDEKLLFEAMSNLVENAIKFIAPRGTIQISVSPNPDGVALVVSDDGSGIAPEERHSVLERYHRGSNSRHTPGSGLGLSLVAAIVHLHGFRLELHDARPGHARPGLEVRIICPANGPRPVTFVAT